MAFVLACMVQIPTEEDYGEDEIIRMTSQGAILHKMLGIWQTEDQGQSRDIGDDIVMLKHMGKNWQKKASMSADIRYEKSEKQFLSFIQTFMIRLTYVIALFTIAMASVDPNNFIQKQGLMHTFSQDGTISPSVSMSPDINTFSIFNCDNLPILVI